MALTKGEILPAKKSFASELGVGIQKGLNDYSEESKQSRLLEKKAQIDILKEQAKIKAKSDLLSKILSRQSSQDNQGFGEQITGGQSSNPIGGDFTNQLMNEEQQPQQGYDPLNITDEMIAKTAAIDPSIARELRAARDTALREKRESEKLEFQKNKVRRGEETEISKPILLEMNEARKNIPLQEQAILDIKEASPGVSSLDYLADVTGFEPFRTAKGVKFKTGVKDFFLSDLTRAGARPNQWIEQQLMDALPKIGRDPIANLITAEGLQFKLDLAKKRIESIDEMAEKDREKYGYVKADIDARAYKDLQKYAIDRQKELSDNIKKIQIESKGKKHTIKIRSPEGKTFEIPREDYNAEEVKKLKYELIAE